MQRKIKAKKNYFGRLCIAVDNMHNKPVNFYSLRRKFSPFLKTSMVGDSLITLHLKNSNKGVLLSIEDKINSTYFIRVKSSKNPDWNFLLSVQSNKELLTKILYKYEFFN